MSDICLRFQPVFSFNFSSKTDRFKPKIPLRTNLTGSDVLQPNCLPNHSNIDIPLIYRYVTHFSISKFGEEGAGGAVGYSGRVDGRGLSGSLGLSGLQLPSDPRVSSCPLIQGSLKSHGPRVSQIPWSKGLNKNLIQYPRVHQSNSIIHILCQYDHDNQKHNIKCPLRNNKRFQVLKLIYYFVGLMFIKET